MQRSTTLLLQCINNPCVFKLIVIDFTSLWVSIWRSKPLFLGFVKKNFWLSITYVLYVQKIGRKSKLEDRRNFKKCFQFTSSPSSVKNKCWNQSNRIIVQRYRAQNLRGVILKNSTKTTSGLIVFEQLEVFQPRCALYLQ